MRPFDYQRVASTAEAIERAKEPNSRFIAGGTTQLDLMKCNVERPATLIDISHLDGMNHISVEDSRIRIGSLARMSEVANSAGIRSAAPALYESLWQAASPQIRNMASIGGNLLQRTRCTYYRDALANAPCNKRSPGSGCAAMNGANRNHAILGVSDACIATYPGDLAIALVAFDAIAHVQGSQRRTLKVEDLHRLPGDQPEREHNLAPGELIVNIEIPRSKALRRSHYLKVRDRASYEFAAASAAVGLEIESDGITIKDVRVAIGGVATRPWRLRVVEQALRGKPFTEEEVRRASSLAAEGASLREHNTFKVTLVPRVVARAFLEAWKRA